MAPIFNPRGYVPQKGSSRRKKRPQRRWIWSVILGGLFLGGMISALFLEWRYRKTMEEIFWLRAENRTLAEKISKLKKNPELYEEIARKKYGYVKKNERLIIFKGGR